MKLISWNVNGLRAALTKGFEDFFSSEDADIFCIQETKLQPEQASFHPEGYFEYWNCAVRRGYSGTAVFTKEKPQSVRFGLGEFFDDHEGRAVTLEFDAFYFLCVYTPNSQNELARLDFRLEWEAALRSYIKTLDATKPVVYCGDLNVAHCEIDLKNPSTNHQSAGFSDEERAAFTALLDGGFSDTYRTLYPERIGYSWWSYRMRAREKNAGWRIDYFVVSDRLMPRVTESELLNDIYGSDHCPIRLTLDV